MKPDERDFLTALYHRRPRQSANSPFATGISSSLGIPYKRAETLMQKWVKKGWWECGVSLRCGWLTEAGLKAARKLIGPSLTAH